MWKVRPYNKDVDAELIKSGKEKLLSRLLSQRITDAKESDKFTSGSYTELSHPHKLKGVKEAVDLFVSAVKGKKSIYAYSDYDVDGVVGATMIRELCLTLGVNCNVILPNRMKQGYGLTEKSIKHIKETSKTPPDLLFIIDSGSSSEKRS